ncbi:MAG: valine--tRNA ligase [Candidatus Methanoplasma sp.]|jgi:valyl-tRNA synthetase|nr:valine--tRNA ligase [Candidatus Methanoplasma sp.]
MSQYDSVSVERRWQKMWKDEEIYRFDPSSDKPAYSIDNPPRYTSGPLHLGHATGYSLIDFAARYKRMKGYNVFFPLCFDVNGTPIEVKVEKKHNITKLDLPREEYRRLCSEYANGFIEEMTHHFEILGESMDPSIYYQTDAPYYRRITQISFVELFVRGLVYKGDFPVNWCPRCMTALADAEVDRKDNTTKLNYVKFGVAGSDDHVTIATTRPELICTCKVVAVHPDDKDKQHLIGKELVTPIYGRKVKVIADPKVDPKYGTGNVMICTIGDKDDLEWVMKYHLEMEKGIDETGKMTELAGKYAGMSVKEARASIISDLKEMGTLTDQKDTPQQVSVCWRCSTPVEYLQVPQWFLRTLELKEQVLQKADEIRWFPDFMKIRLQDWVESLEWDWVLSRQRIFATPVPVWECEDCGEAVCAKEEQCYIDPTIDPPPVDKCQKCGGKLLGCTDVFDTWMDSSGSSLYNTFWKRDDALHEKFFPMSMRPQSHDIIRTWAFYSILRAEQLKQSRPWDDIMVHGFIMAPDGTPMHSSVGNVIDPIPILKNYGADALRYFAASCSLGTDHAFREPDVVRGRKLANKMFNIGQFVGRFFDGRSWDTDDLRISDKWIISRYSQTVEAATAYLDEYQFDKAMKEVEGFIWRDLADNYIEMVKARKDDAVRNTLYNVLLGCIKMMAPVMPHVTEDIYQEHFLGTEGIKSIHMAEWPVPIFIDEDALETGESVAGIISAIRAWKSDRKMPLNAELSKVEVIGEEAPALECGSADIIETSKIKNLVFSKEALLKEEVVGVRPVHSKLGPAFKGQAKDIVAALKALTQKDVSKRTMSEGIRLDIGGETVFLAPEFFEIDKRLTLDGKAVETIQLGKTLVVLEI